MILVLMMMIHIIQDLLFYTLQLLSEDWISIVRKLFDPPLDNEFREFELFPAANADTFRLIVRG